MYCLFHLTYLHRYLIISLLIFSYHIYVLWFWKYDCFYESHLIFANHLQLASWNYMIDSQTLYRMQKFILNIFAFAHMQIISSNDVLIDSWVTYLLYISWFGIKLNTFQSFSLSKQRFSSLYKTAKVRLRLHFIHYLSAVPHGNPEILFACLCL